MVKISDMVEINSLKSASQRNSQDFYIIRHCHLVNWFQPILAAKEKEAYVQVYRCNIKNTSAEANHTHVGHSGEQCKPPLVWANRIIVFCTFQSICQSKLKNLNFMHFSKGTALVHPCHNTACTYSKKSNKNGDFSCEGGKQDICMKRAPKSAQCFYIEA